LISIEVLQEIRRDVTRKVRKNAAEASAKAEKPIDAASTSHLRDVTAAAPRIFGWDKPFSGAAVQFNQNVLQPGAIRL
jgi:hypothetical protein